MSLANRTLIDQTLWGPWSISDRLFWLDLFDRYPYYNIPLDLCAVCMSSVSGSSLTIISLWTCMLCVCRLFPGLHLIKYHFGLVCYVYVFCLFPDRPLLEYPFGLACFVYIVCFWVITLLEYPFGLACYVYVFCFRVVPLLEYPLWHDASTSDNISVWNWSFNTHRNMFFNCFFFLYA